MSIACLFKLPRILEHAEAYHIRSSNEFHIQLSASLCKHICFTQTGKRISILTHCSQLINLSQCPSIIVKTHHSFRPHEMRVCIAEDHSSCGKRTVCWRVFQKPHTGNFVVTDQARHCLRDCQRLACSCLKRYRGSISPTIHLTQL